MATVSAPIVRHHADDAANLTAAVVRYVLDHNTVYGFDRLLLSAVEQHPGDRRRQMYAFRGDLKAAVKLSLESDARGPLGVWMLRATMAGVDWIDVSEELCERGWDDDYLADLAGTVAAEVEEQDAHRAAFDAPEFYGRSEVDEMFGTSPGDELLILPEHFGDRDPDRHSVGRVHAAQLR